MDAVATFLRSPVGQYHVASCREFGQDPAAFIEDDFVAMNLRAGALYLDRIAKRKAREEADNPTVAMDRWVRESERG